MEALVGFVSGAVLSALWTAWVMQRALNRQSIIPTKVQKAKVFTPTSADIDRKNAEMAKRAKKLKQEDFAKSWRERTGIPFEKMVGKKK